MAVDAKLHIEIVNLCYPVHFLYITMTMAAVYLPVDMNRVVEKNKIRHVLYFQPFHRLVFIIMSPQVFNLRVMNNDFFMAKHTCLKWRYPSPLRVDSSVMAHETAYSFFGGMDPVTEMHGLLCSFSDSEIIPRSGNPCK